MHAALNWIGQGAVVALVALGVLRVTMSVRAQARYVLLWVAAIAILALPLLPDLSQSSASIVRAAGDDGSMLSSVVVSMPATWWTSSIAMFGLWGLWIALAVCRLSTATLALRRARRRCSPFPADVEARLRHWMRVSPTGRRARLVLSEDVRGAGVLGCGSPTIALAPALLTHLSDDELDHIVIHEWAHVQRRDDLGQAAQVFVHAIAGWHPAIIWIGRHLHAEREVACDQIAVDVSRSAKRYAASLVTLAGLPIATRVPMLALGAVSRTGLQQRIGRILAHHRAAPRRGSLPVTAGILVVLTLALTVSQVRVIDALDAPSPVPALLDASNPYTRALHDVLTADATTASPARPRHDMAPPQRTPRVQLAAAPAIVGEATPAQHVAVDAIPMASAPVAPEADRRLPVDTARADPAPPIASALPKAAASLPVDGTAAPDATNGASKPPTPWSAAADGGVALGRASRTAGVATAGFFTRVSKKIAHSF